MSTTLQPARTDVVVPETPADARTVETHPAWLRLKAAATALQPLQVKDGSIPDPADHAAAREHVETIVAAVEELAPLFPHDAAYLFDHDVEVDVDLDGCATNGGPEADAAAVNLMARTVGSRYITGRPGGH